MKCATCLFIILYNAVFELCRLFILPLLATLRFASHWNIEQRCGLPPCSEGLDGRTVVWVHAASLGESKLLVKFLGILQKRHPDHVYVLTATTRTGVDYLSAVRRPGVIAAGFLPLDTLRLMKKMLRRFAVSRLWIMETELWPSMLWSCMKAGVPVGIVNARMEHKSVASYSRFRLVCEPMFRSLSLVLAQNEQYAARFQRIGVRPDALHITGNLKGLVEINPPALEEVRALRKSMKLEDGDFVLTAGCVHAGEGRILREALDVLAGNGRRVKCIVVPRHLNDSPSLVSELGAHTILLHDIVSPSAWDACVVRKMGVLEPLYKIADASFIGGTFVPVGGHNVWDAAQFGIPVFFGPDFHTQRESCEKLIAAGVGFTVDSARQLAERIAAVSRTDTSAFASELSQFIKSAHARMQTIERLIP